MIDVVLNPLSSKTTPLGSIRLTADILLQESKTEQSELKFTTGAVFESYAWESELIWQAARMIEAHHGNTSEVVKALEKCLAKLKK